MDKTLINNKIESLIKNSEHDIAVLVKDLTNNEIIIDFKSSNTYLSASLIKLPILIEGLSRVYSMEIPLNQTFPISKGQKVDYSVITEQDLEKCTFEELLEWMIITSDNTACNVLIDILGMDKINQAINTMSLSGTKLERKMMDSEAVLKGKNNYTSLQDMLHLMEGLYRGTIAENEICKRALNTLKNQRDNGMLKRYIKDNVILANKTGELDDLNNDVGIFYTKKIDYFIGVFAHNLNSNSQGYKIIGQISKMIYDFLVLN